MSYLSDYLPTLSELTDAQLRAGRDKALAFLRQGLPDITLEPGSPAGDSLVTPMGLLFAGCDESNRRRNSDMDLSNVSAGTIYSCDFVRAFLGNYGVYDVDRAAGYGVVRLTFSSNVSRSVPVHTLFRFGSSDYRPLASSTASVVVINACGDAPDGADHYELAQTSASTWAVDIPLTGGDAATVQAGDGCVLSLAVDGLIGAVAVVDFANGTPSAGLSDLANMARKTSWAVNSPTRGGMSSSVWRNWPEARMVSPVLTGDQEMVRVVSNGPTIIQAPAVDLYFRSQYDMQVASQMVKLYYAECDEDEVSRGRFRGPVTFLGRPSKIVSTEWSGTSVESFVESAVWVSEPDEVGTVGERFHVSVTPVIDGITSLPEIPLLEDDGGLYAMFTITFLYDPALAFVSSTMTNGDNAPVGVSVSVVPGPLVEIAAFTVEFARQPGVKTLTQPAAAALSSAVSASGYPAVYRQSVVHDVMKQAGAGRVKSVLCSATASVTPSARVFASVEDPGGAGMWDDWILGSAEVTTLELSENDLLGPVVTHDDHSGLWLEHWVLSERTARLYLPEAAITFVET